MTASPEFQQLPNEPNPYAVMHTIRQEAGDDPRAYLDVLYQHQIETTLGQSLTGAAYMVGTRGKPDPFELNFERARSFDDGLTLGLRTAKELLGSRYIEMMTDAMELLTIDEWKEFFRTTSPSAMAEGVEELTDDALEGMELLDDYMDFAQEWAARLPCYDENDNLLTAGFGYVFKGIIVTRENFKFLSSVLRMDQYREAPDQHDTL